MIIHIQFNNILYVKANLLIHVKGNITHIPNNILYYIHNNILGQVKVNILWVKKKLGKTQHWQHKHHRNALRSCHKVHPYIKNKICLVQFSSTATTIIILESHITLAFGLYCNIPTQTITIDKIIGQQNTKKAFRDPRVT